ncbi:cyclic GMP-AMP synthase [Scomber japonicus]|uniref:cyclic GMP-AMP synthase n=1 Tax=Scomber japonicus TaxID=13676 RepID=UPI0023059513|nr:cyclic GMP-AMP synthase [Scomber japonicus]
MDGEDRGDRDVSLSEDTRGRSSPPRSTSVRQRQRVQQPSVEGCCEDEKSVSVSPKLTNWIKLNAKDLKIRLTDRRWAAEVVNDFRENLLRFLKNNEDQPFFQSVEFLTSGSYFEKVKIHSPDEFDMMLKLPVPSRLKMTKLDSGLFYQIDLARPTRTPIRAFVLENKLTLSSSKILSEMYRLVRKFLKTYKGFGWEVNRKRLNSPAVTLSLYKTGGKSDELISVDVVPALEVNHGWPLAVRNGPDVEKWLGKKFRQEIKTLPCFFVPKRLKGRKLSEEAKESWRISFSLIEKKIITLHGNKKTCCESNATKCCRKQCLMLLKSLITGLKQRFPKELDDLCSYHGKTAFLNTLSVRYQDSMWACQNLPACFLYLLKALEDYASVGFLPHFFVPECNLFSSTVFPRKTLAFLINALQEQRREGLPLLKPPGPVPPLRQLSLLTGSSIEEEESTQPTHQMTTFQCSNTTFMHKILLMVAALVFALFVVINGK